MRETKEDAGRMIVDKFHLGFPAKEVKSMKNETNATANREYKSNVFAMLFEDREKLLELYNALNHSHYTDTNELEIVTLKNAIYMSMKNDLAFVLNCKLMLYEHQSTPNPNMPLRDLFYVSKEYEKMVATRSLYSRSKLTIPAPHFIVFYNGVEQQPERKVLKLSDLYHISEDEPMLELEVLMLNINDGNNEELKKLCKTLKEYMQFVNRVRKLVCEEKMELNLAVEQAVTECIREGILEEFLIKNRAEVVAMSIFEFDEEKELKLLREAEFQYGVEVGKKEGRKEGHKEGRIEGAQLYLVECVCKKLRKGKIPELIAEELEEEKNTIERICEVAGKFAPEYNEEDILREIVHKSGD